MKSVRKVQVPSVPRCIRGGGRDYVVGTRLVGLPFQSDVKKAVSFSISQDLVKVNFESCPPRFSWHGWIDSGAYSARVQDQERIRTSHQIQVLLAASIVQLI